MHKRSRFVQVISIFLCFLFVISGTHAQDEKEERFDSLQRQLLFLHQRIELEEYRLAKGESADSLPLFHRMIQYILSDPDQAWQTESPEIDLQSGRQQRKWKILSDMMTTGKIEGYPSVILLKDSLAHSLGLQPGTAFLPSATASALQRQLQLETEPSAVTRLLRRTGTYFKETERLLQQLLTERNRLAQAVGADDYMQLLTDQSGISQSDLRKIAAELDFMTDSAFKEIRKRMNKSKDTELEPWLLPVRLNHALKDFDFLFPADSQLVWIKHTLEGFGIDLEALPIYIDIDKAESTRQIFARTYLLQSPFDIRIVAQLSNGYLSFELLARAISKAVAAAAFSDSALFFAVFGDMAWEDGMSDILPRICRESEWLQNFPKLSKTQTATLLQLLKDRESVQVRWFLANTIFSMDVYANPAADLQQLYLDNIERYLFVRPDETLAPWLSDREWISNPLANSYPIIGKIIAAQSITYLKKRHPVLHENPDVFAFLMQNYFRFGGRYAWHDLLERGTGEPLSPSHLFPTAN